MSFFDLILMSKLTWITERVLEREIKNKGRKENTKIYIGDEKTRNARGHQGESERQ